MAGTHWSETNQDLSQVFEIEYKIVNSEIKKIVAVPVHDYNVSDIFPCSGSNSTAIYDDLLSVWMNTDKGRWVIKHSRKTPKIIKGYHASSYEIMFRVIAFFYEEDATMYMLKWK